MAFNDFKKAKEQAKDPQTPPPLPEEAAEPAAAPTSADISEFFAQKLGKDVLLQGKHLVDMAIARITESRAYFRDTDIIRAALRRAQHDVEEAVLEKKEFEEYIKWVVSQYPLVPVGNTNYLTTHEMANAERSIMVLAAEKNDVYIQPKEVVAAAIGRKKGISKEQSDAVIAACSSPKRVTVIEGAAGAGKSFTMEAVKETYMEMGYSVMGTALGWAAAKVLGESAKLEDENCKAIEGLTRSWLEARKNGIDPFNGPTLLIVDEAGMVGTKHMALILEETKRSRYPVKVVLTGDSLQVVPVAAGNALQMIIKFEGTTRIDTIRRQHQFSHRSAVRRFSQLHSGQALNTFLQQECVHWCKDKDMLLNMVLRNYVSYRLAYPDKKALVLTLSNKDVLELNFRIRAAYKKLGLIGGDDVRLTVNNGIEAFETDFSVGDEVLLRANDKNMIVYDIDPSKNPLKEHTWKAKRLGVFNRNSGRIVAMRRSKDPIGSYDFVIDLAGDNPGRVIINSDKFRSPDKPGMPMIHNYAGTIYGSQGQTVAQVFLIDSPRMEFRLAYVGMSRHKENVDIYLDETELHRRLDNAVGKRQSLESRLQMEKSGKSLEDAKVDLGRYTRSEMLRAVALCWGKHSANLTATVFEYDRRHGLAQMQKDVERLAKVEAPKPKETVVDYLQEFNVPYPLVDIEKILELPDPIGESELVRPSDREENKSRYGASEMPVDAQGTPLPMPARAAPLRHTVGTLPTEKEETFLGRAFDWLLSTKKPAAVQAPAPKPALRLQDPVSAFDDLEGVEPEKEDPSLLEKLNAWLNPKPKVKIPYVANTKPCGKVVFPEPDKEIEKALRLDGVLDPRPHYIDFDGVPTVANVEGGPSNEWIAQQKEKMWTVGKYGEPRILACDAHSNVVARYRLDGTCVVGEGQPPICVNRHGSPTSPVYIVAGAKEWLWLRQTMEEKHAEDPSKIPHIIWGAKDVDWKYIASSLKSSERVVVVRTKADDRQIPWAVSLQKMLKERHRIDSVISPKVPDEALNAALQELEAKASTNRRLKM